MSERFGSEGEYNTPGRHERDRRKSARERVPRGLDFHPSVETPKYRGPFFKSANAPLSDSQLIASQLEKIDRQIKEKQDNGESVEALLAIRSELQGVEQNQVHAQAGAALGDQEIQDVATPAQEQSTQINLRNLYQGLTKLNGDIRSLEGDLERKCQNIKDLIQLAEGGGEREAISMQLRNEQSEAKEIAKHIESKLVELKKMEETLHSARPTTKDKSRAPHVMTRLHDRLAYLQSVESSHEAFLHNTVSESQLLPLDDMNLTDVGNSESTAVATIERSAQIEDELFDQAREIVVSSGNPSISHLQRRLRIGYNRASRLIDTLKEQGIINDRPGASLDINQAINAAESSANLTPEQPTQDQADTSATPARVAAFTAAATVAAAAAESIVQSVSGQATPESIPEPTPARQEARPTPNVTSSAQVERNTETRTPRKQSSGWSISDLPKDYKQSDRQGHTEALMNAATVLPWLTYEMGKEAVFAIGRGVKQAGGFLWSALKGIGGKLFGGR